MKTTLRHPEKIERSWYQIDARKFPLGRMSTRISTILMGKHHVDYTPHVDMGDFVVVTNAEQLYVTGKKLEQKTYTKFSGYPGGITRRTMKDVLAHSPEMIIREAVRTMLPKNKLRRLMLRRLKIVKGESHDFTIEKTIDK